jgi:drug/metabolite transporter (DMT)-like permease
VTFERMPRIIAVAEALSVTVVLGSTLVLVKLVLNTLGPLSITAFRYSLAFVSLIPFVVVRGGLGHYPRPLWRRFILLGVSFYVIGNGALYVGLKFIPATTASLPLSLVPLLVMLAGILFLGEIPGRTQYAGLAVVVIGSVVFFLPA